MSVPKKKIEPKKFKIKIPLGHYNRMFIKMAEDSEVYLIPLEGSQTKDEFIFTKDSLEEYIECLDNRVRPLLIGDDKYKESAETENLGYLIKALAKR